MPRLRPLTRVAFVSETSLTHGVLFFTTNKRYLCTPEYLRIPQKQNHPTNIGTRFSSIQPSSSPRQSPDSHVSFLLGCFPSHLPLPFETNPPGSHHLHLTSAMNQQSVTQSQVRPDSRRPSHRLVHCVQRTRYLVVTKR